MSGRTIWHLTGAALLSGALLMGVGFWVTVAAKDLPPEAGPDVVILRELENMYEPVPFEHKSHAKMAQMWNGCVTCHHRSPQTTAQQAEEAASAGSVPGTVGASLKPAGTASEQTLDSIAASEAKTQEASAKIPACKSCHPTAPVDVDIFRPSLKGAYHRQCLNCHQEWMHENACAICHEPKEGRQAVNVPPSPDDIVGRMHPPIPEPDAKAYKTRFTPAAGGNVLFRHREHTVRYDIKCVNCHYQDNCSHCHGPTGDTSEQKPLRPGMTWDESHGPCMGCHRQNRCRHCHYKDDQSPPEVFDHTATGQALDEEHAKLACGQCHPDLRVTTQPVCGDATCHNDKKIEYPFQRPGPMVMTEPPAWAAVYATAGMLCGGME
jgi:hypothetical protein